MIKSLLSAAALAAAFVGPAQAAQYTLDPTHSFVEFRIQHLGYSWLYGRFNDIKGTLDYDAEDPNASKVEVEIATASVDSNHAERDKHLRNSDFLDVKKYPTATFVSSAFEANDVGGTLTGTLTLHGVSKEVSIDVTKVGEGKDPWGGYRAGFIGTMELTRSDFDMGYNLGPASETMQLELSIEGIRN